MIYDEVDDDLYCTDHKKYDECYVPISELYLRRSEADKLYAKKDGGTITLPDGSNIDLSDYLKKEAAEQIYLKKDDAPVFDKTGLATETFVNKSIKDIVNTQDTKNSDFNKRINDNVTNISNEKKINETQNNRLTNIDAALLNKLEKTTFESHVNENTKAHTALEENITNKTTELNTKIEDHIKVYEAAINLKADKTELANKQDKLIAGKGINISDTNEISAAVSADDLQLKVGLGIINKDGQLEIDTNKVATIESVDTKITAETTARTEKDTELENAIAAISNYDDTEIRGLIATKVGQDEVNAAIVDLVDNNTLATTKQELVDSIDLKANKVDVEASLGNKQDKLKAGKGINISADNEISAAVSADDLQIKVGNGVINKDGQLEVDPNVVATVTKTNELDTKITQEIADRETNDNNITAKIEALQKIYLYNKDINIKANDIVIYGNKLYVAQEEITLTDWDTDKPKLVLTDSDTISCVSYDANIKIIMGQLVIHDSQLFLCNATIENTTTWEDDKGSMTAQKAEIDLTNYYDKKTIDNHLSNKENTLTVGDDIEIDRNTANTIKVLSNVDAVVSSIAKRDGEGSLKALMPQTPTDDTVINNKKLTDELALVNTKITEETTARTDKDTELQGLIDAKQDKLIAGKGINISDTNEISAAVSADDLQIKVGLGIVNKDGQLEIDTNKVATIESVDTKITAETTARTEKDTELENAIAAIPTYDDTEIKAELAKKVEQTAIDAAVADQLTKTEAATIYDTIESVDKKIAAIAIPEAYDDTEVRDLIDGKIGQDAVNTSIDTAKQELTDSINLKADKTELANKQDKLIAGKGINISDTNEISATDQSVKYVQGDGIIVEEGVDSNTIKVDETFVAKKADLDTEIQNRTTEDTKLQANIDALLKVHLYADQTVVKQNDLVLRNGKVYIANKDMTLSVWDTDVTELTSTDSDTISCVSYDANIKIEAGKLVINNNELYLCETTVENTTTWEDDKANFIPQKVAVDLTEYYKSSAVDNLLNTKTDKTTFEQEVTDRNAKIAEIEGKITKEITDRTEKDADFEARITTNTQNITTESTERKEADTNLDNKITTESTERKEADTNLDNKITTEYTERTEADTLLEGKITEETTNRETADTDINNTIGDINILKTESKDSIVNSINSIQRHKVVTETEYNEMVKNNTIDNTMVYEIVGEEINPVTDNQFNDMFNKIYPVGSIYITVNPTFSPETAFGGKWRKIEQGRYLRATEDVNKVGQKVEAGLPAHTHSASYVSSKTDWGVTGINLQAYKQGITSYREYDYGRTLTTGNPSNSIYGKSNTVTPASIDVIIYERYE